MSVGKKIELEYMLTMAPYTLISRLGGNEEKAIFEDDVRRLLLEAFALGYQTGAADMAKAL